MAPALEMHRIAKLYGRTAALKAVSFRLEQGQTLALLGPNGSGKTTLLKILAGAIRPTLGSGEIFGRDLRTERPALRSEVGLLAAESYLYDNLTAEENLRFVLVMAGRRVERTDLGAALRQVGLHAQADWRVSKFSSGMRRRLALARLVLLRPRLLLLDEPYVSLDAEAAETVDGLVRSQGREGGAAVLATHDVERALSLADQVALLERGVLRYSGPAGGYRVRGVEHVG
jgi:heme exporter protein A